MPSMPRTDNKARKIAFDLLGIPSNMEKFYKSSKKSKPGIDKAMKEADVQQHYKSIR